MARSDRAEYRKTQRMIEHTHGGYAGKSLLEKITDELDAAVERYLAAKDSTDPLVGLKTEMIARGEVRGLARALTIFAIPIYPNVKAAEKAAVRRVKEKQDAAEQALAQEERG